MFISSIFKSFIENRYTSRRFVFIIDLFIVVLASLISYFIVRQVYGSLEVMQYPDLKYYLLLTLCCNAIFIFIYRTYKGVIRDSGLYDFLRIFLAFSCAEMLVFIVLHGFIGQSGSVSLVYCCILFLISVIGSFAFRVSVVLMYQQLVNSFGKDRAVSFYIWGMDDQNLALSKILNATQKKFMIKGFIIPSTDLHRKKLTDLSVLLVDVPSDFANIKLGNSAILFTDQKELKSQTLFIKELLSLNIPIYKSQFKDIECVKAVSDTMPSIKSLQIEDLLGRPEIDISIDSISQNINNKTVLVTGSAGSIGSEIVRQLSNFNPKTIICFDQAETPLNDLFIELSSAYPSINFNFILGDIRNVNAITNVFEQYHPDIIYHAAAYKHVPILEQFPNEAIIANVFATKVLVDLSIEYKVQQFVMISSDKAVNPTNIMGCSKRIAEIYVQSAALDQNKNKGGTAFITTRFGNVLGSNGSVVPLFRRQIEAGGPITVTHPEITRYFMTIPEACRLVLESTIIGKSGHIYVFDMGKPVKILDMAIKMIKLANLKPYEDISIIFSGLRPGEKLYEELLNDAESIIPTTHKKVLIAKVREYQFSEIESIVEQLVHLARNNNNTELVPLMRNLVPEYKKQIYN